MRSRFALIAILFVAGTFSRANEPTLGASWTTVVQRLQAQKINKIGDFDLNTFSKTATQIRWQRVEADQLPETNEGRRSAFFLVKRKEVFVLQSLPKNLPTAALELHEALGASGYNDKNYQLSSSLILLSKMPAGKLKNELAGHLATSTFSKAQMMASESGSGSSVSGGGDLIALTAKNAVIEKLLELRTNVSTEFLTGVLATNFEPFYDPDQQFVAIQYLTADANDNSLLANSPPYRASGKKELISVYVPALTWVEKPAARGRLVKEMVDRLFWLFPNPKNLPAQDKHLVDCGQKKIPFPRADGNDVMTLSLQEIRAAVIYGCPDIPIATEARDPVFRDYAGNEETKPLMTAHEKENFLIFKCSLQIQGQKQKLEFDFHSEKGQPRSKMYGGPHTIGSSGLPGSKAYLNVVLSHDEQGLITRLYLQQKDESKNGRALEQSKFFKEPSKNGELLMSLFSNHQIKLTCDSTSLKDR